MIGQWYRAARGQKWHLVDSLVARVVVTRCGRHLPQRDNDEWSEVMPLTRMIGQPQLCKGGCD